MITTEQIEKYKDAKAKLQYWKKQELLLRNEICSNLFENKVGWFNVKYEVEGFKITAKSKVKYAMDLEEIQEMSVEGKLTQTDVECFKSKIELIESKIKKLGEDSILWSAITQSPATPELEIKNV